MTNAAALVATQCESLLASISKLRVLLVALAEEKPAAKPRKLVVAKGAAESFADEVIETITEAAGESAPKKRGRPKGSKNASAGGARPHGQIAAIIRGRIEDLGIGESITTSVIATICKIAPSNASREASKLLEAGVLERAGRGAFRIRAIPAA